MKNKNYIYLGIGLLLAACASQNSVNRKIDQEVKAEAPVAVGGPLATESRALILDSSDLSQEQKDKLLALHAKMATEVAGIRDEEGKLKMVFFKTLLDPKSEEKEIITIKNRILALDRKKTNEMLSAMEEARKILGRDNKNAARYYRAFNAEPGRISSDLF